MRRFSRRPERESTRRTESVFRLGTGSSGGLAGRALARAQPREGASRRRRQSDLGAAPVRSDATSCSWAVSTPIRTRVAGGVAMRFAVAMPLVDWLSCAPGYARAHPCRLQGAGDRAQQEGVSGPKEVPQHRQPTQEIVREAPPGQSATSCAAQAPGPPCRIAAKRYVLAICNGYCASGRVGA